MKGKLVREIIFTSLFLIITTLFIYVPKNEELATSLAFASNMRSLNMVSVTDDIVMDKYYPVSDEVGLTFTDNIFKIVNNSNTSKDYKIEFRTGNKNLYDNLLSNSNIRYSYKINDGEYSEPCTLSEDGIISVETIDGKSENTYYLKIWVSTTNYSDVDGKLFQGVIELNV